MLKRTKVYTGLNVVATVLVEFVECNLDVHSGFEVDVNSCPQIKSVSYNTTATFVVYIG